MVAPFPTRMLLLEYTTEHLSTRQAPPILGGMAFRKRYARFAVAIYQVLIDPLISPLRPRVVRLCRALEVSDALDIASGTGAQCRALSRAGIPATGVDSSDDMIRAAIRRGLRGVRYTEGSAYDLPFEASSFDACLLILALHEHSPSDRIRMLTEAVRVARRYVIIADYEEPARSRTNLAWQVIRLVEETAGCEHREGFKEYVAGGSLDGFLDRQRLSVVREDASHFGTIRLAAVTIADSLSRQ